LSQAFPFLATGADGMIFGSAASSAPLTAAAEASSFFFSLLAFWAAVSVSEVGTEIFSAIFA